MPSKFKGDIMKKQKCIICRKPLSNGISINGIKICKVCEERLIKVQVETDFYDYYKECIRKTIVQSLIKGADVKCHSYR